MPIVLNEEIGRSGYVDIVRKFARAENFTGELIVWDGVNGYDGWLDVEEDIEWSSNSEADILGGAGVDYLQFTGQGEDGIEKTYYGEVLGTTWNRLSNTDAGVLFNCIYTAQCLNTQGLNTSPLSTGGSANSGTITIRSVTTQRVMAIILPNLGRTQMQIWRCPSDSWAEFHKIDIYPTSGKPVLCKLMARNDISQSWICVGQVDFDGGAVSIVHPFPDYISPGTDLCLVAVAEQAGTNISTQMWIKKMKIRDR